MSEMTELQKKDAERVKLQIRNAVANVYDLQKMRIAAGNRLVQSFYQSLGVEPSTSPNDLDNEKEEKKVIDQLKKEYKRVTDGVSENNFTVKKQIKIINDSKEESLKYIRDVQDFNLIDAYMLLLASEERLTKVLDTFVKSHPLWEEFFEPIKGCGTLMSAVCIAYLDPYKARHISSFYRYCGLDTVQDVDSDGNKLWLTKDGDKHMKVRAKMGYITSDGLNYFGTAKATTDYDADGNQIFKGEDGEILTQYFVTKEVNGETVQVYESIEDGEEYVGNVVASEHGRRKGDTEMFEYTDKDGNIQMKRGITYNPIIKTKLMGVLTGCLLKAKDPVYSTMYYDYRARLDKSSYHKDYSDGRKNMMAQRYMVKQFLRNLWTTWRLLEGLPIDNPYEVEKLGNEPHRYNAYQVDNASGQRKSYRDFHAGLASGNATGTDK